MEVYKLTFNQENLDAFYREYFKTYPLRSKQYIETPIVPSLNRWLSLSPKARSPIKNAWRDYVAYVVKEAGLTGLNLTSCRLNIHYIFPDRRLSDLDNRTPKLIQDSLTKAGVWTDDNYTVVKELRLTGSYSKNNPAMVLTIEEVA